MFFPANFSISSLHLVPGLFLLLLSLYGHQSVILVYLLSFILAICSAHLFFYCLITCIMSFTQVFSLIQGDLFLSLNVFLNITLFMSLCAILSEFSICFVCFHVLHLYVMAGITHWLCTLRFRHIGSLFFSTSRFLPNVFQTTLYGAVRYFLSKLSFKPNLYVSVEVKTGF